MKFLRVIFVCALIALAMVINAEAKPVVPQGNDQVSDIIDNFAYFLN